MHQKIKTNTDTADSVKRKKYKVMNAQSIYAGFLYTCKQVNMYFKIKVFGIFYGKKINTLVGVSGLIKLIGTELANKFVARAFNCMDDVCICKLRRGLKVSFYTF